MYQTNEVKVVLTDVDLTPMKVQQNNLNWMKSYVMAHQIFVRINLLKL